MPNIVIIAVIAVDCTVLFQCLFEPQVECLPWYPLIDKGL